MSTQVKNLNNTSDKKPPNGYNSWLDYWEKKSGSKAEKCSNVDCKVKYDLVGAHVKKEYNNTNYIVPLCNSCNKIDSIKTFTVDKELIPAG